MILIPEHSRGRIASTRHSRERKKTHGGRSSSGSSTLSRPYQDPSSFNAASCYDLIPSSAKLPCSEIGNTWYSSTGDTKSNRTVIGEKVLIRQQPAAPPPEPQILVLSDQMLERAPTQDKYMKVLSMFGYALLDYTHDINDELIDLTFPYIIIHLGTMQLGLFDPVKN